MDIRDEIEQEVRKALRDHEKHHLHISYVGRKTIVSIWVDHGMAGMAGVGRANCAPGDDYIARVGYELALDRAIRDVVERLLRTRTDIRCEDECYDWTHGGHCNARCSVLPPVTPETKQPPKPTRVRITKQPASPLSWYYDKVGEEFGVYEWKSSTLWCLSLDGIDNRIIDKSDCEVVTTPSTPQRQRAVVVDEPYVYCDDDHAAFISTLSFVTHIGEQHKSGARELYLDPRYDHDASVAYIEAIGT